MIDDPARSSGDEQKTSASAAQPSPCLGICRIDPEDGLCVGCFRSLEEICNWLTLAETEKQAVIDACDRRRKERGGE